MCVNDGSTDDSLSILERFSQSYDNFRVISQINAGYGRAINVGIQHAKGEFVAIVESDDVILPNVHQRIIEIFKKFPEVDFVKTPYQPWSPLNPRNVVSLPNPVSTIDNILKSEDGFS
ncbi:glycosyltransferase [Ochrobactrum grignonense]|nr:glycosyltransferase [Brucella grignonensis]